MQRSLTIKIEGRKPEIKPKSKYWAKYAFKKAATQIRNVFYYFHFL